MVCNGKSKQHRQIRCSGFFWAVPVFRGALGCSRVFQSVSVFLCSGVPVFRCSGVLVFRCSGVPVFRCAGVPVFLVAATASEPEANERGSSLISRGLLYRGLQSHFLTKRKELWLCANGCAVVRARNCGYARTEILKDAPWYGATNCGI